MPTTKNTYSQTHYLNLLRWLATLAVVLIHIVSGVTDVFPETLTLLQYKSYNIIHSLLNWAVPIFIMISGVLFLNPEKEISLKTMYQKYISRIVFALFSFGTYI